MVSDASRPRDAAPWCGCVTRSESPATGHPHPSISRDNTGTTSGPFSGEVAGFYARFRRGYPGEILDAVIDLTALHANDIVLDLGCGTGQLTLPLARRVRVAVGMDPEPDMLALARRAAAAAGVAALLAGKVEAKNPVVIISGGNVASQTASAILAAR